MTRTRTKPRPRPAVAAAVNGHPAAAGASTIPHDPEAERGALGCVLLAGAEGSQPEQDAILAQLRPGLFYDERHRAILAAMVTLRAERHAVDSLTLFSELRRLDQVEAVGGLTYLQGLENDTPSWRAFPTILGTLQGQALRRWTLAKQARLAELALAPGLNVEDLRAEFAELSESAERIGSTAAPLVEFVSPSGARAYVADPRTYLLGDGLICRGELTVIAGWPGLGKSRLATTLAVAGARGSGWMGYPMRRRFRTVIVQSENSLARIKSEWDAVADAAELDEWVAISKPAALRFSDPRFRRELRRVLVDRGADLLIVDPWSDVTRDEGFADHQEALDNLREVTGMGDEAPALVMVAHLRKQRGGDSWKPRAGRELLHELAGSFALGAKARTVFVLQPASMDPADDRVVFDAGKSNNETPEPASCWHRRNGAFVPAAGFDFEAWLNPPDEGGRGKVITADTLKRLLAGRLVARKALVDELKSAGYGASTAYRKTDPDGEFAGRLVETDGLLSWAEA